MSRIMKFNPIISIFRNRGKAWSFFIPGPNRRHRSMISYGLLALGLNLLILACSNAVDSDSVPVAEASTGELVILWDKGYVLEEDEAIEQMVADWQEKSGVDVELSFYNSHEIAPKTLRASRAGTPPDILFASKSVYPISDWTGKLADISDVVKPIEDLYSLDALQAAKIYGAETDTQRYYAVPLSQSTTHIYYRKDLLAQAGYSPADIPQDWDGFWQFWKTVQDRLRSQSGFEQTYGMGLPLSPGASDTYRIFEQILEAYDVQLLDAQGRLLVEQPEVRQGVIQCLEWYVQFYQQAYVPPQAVDWLDTDNNRFLLNREVVMTPNPTLSIPAAVRNDPDTYLNKLGTIEFPNQPNGDPTPHLVDVRQAIVFKDSPNQAAAKDFLSYLSQPDVLSNFLKSAYGRFLPINTQLSEDPFWSDPADPHISTVTKTLIDGRTQSYYNTLNPVYSIVMEENIWGQAIYQMAAEGVSAEKAADQAIAHIKQIFDRWR